MVRERVTCLLHRQEVGQEVPPEEVWSHGERDSVGVSHRGTSVSDLRKLAEAATPGPWHITDTGDAHWEREIRSGDRLGSSQVAWCGGRMGQAQKDAAFIAAASPDVVLGLLDEVAQWKQAAELNEQDYRDLRDDRDRYREAVRRLEAAITDSIYASGVKENGPLLAVLADPVVRRITDECPSCHQHSGNHTMECDK